MATLKSITQSALRLLRLLWFPSAQSRGTLRSLLVQLGARQLHSHSFPDHLCRPVCQPRVWSGGRGRARPDHLRDPELLPVPPVSPQFNNMLLYCVPRVLQVGAQFQVRTRIDVAGMKVSHPPKRTHGGCAGGAGPWGEMWWSSAVRPLGGSTAYPRAVHSPGNSLAFLAIGTIAVHMAMCGQCSEWQVWAGLVGLAA